MMCKECKRNVDMDIWAMYSGYCCEDCREVALNRAEYSQLTLNQCKEVQV